jgi:hypothetical protein
MENYELYIPPVLVNPVNGRFLQGHKPFNKGVPMVKWMDGRKIRKVKKYLEIGRTKGNERLAELNRKKVVSIKDGKLTAYNSITEAALILRDKGINISARNICSVCHAKVVKVRKYSYVRKKAGGFQWFFADQPEKYFK